MKERFVKSHDSPVTCCCYSEALKQVITACEGSVGGTAVACTLRWGEDKLPFLEETCHSCAVWGGKVQNVARYQCFKAGSSHGPSISDSIFVSTEFIKI